jgi:hypothetical protein
VGILAWLLLCGFRQSSKSQCLHLKNRLVAHKSVVLIQSMVTDGKCTAVCQVLGGTL